MTRPTKSAHDHDDAEFQEALRLLDGALDVLSDLARDPRPSTVSSANGLIDELRAWGCEPKTSAQGT